ncbi:MAG: hypothetical protein ACKV2Q_29195 [Planctomycetaceae bacterium]
MGQQAGDAQSIHRILAEPNEGLNREVTSVRPTIKISSVFLREGHPLSDWNYSFDQIPLITIPLMSLLKSWNDQRNLVKGMKNERDAF